MVDTHTLLLLLASNSQHSETSSSAASFWWLTPVLALLGALLGAIASPWVSGAVAERRADKALIREARIALERWNSTRIGPDVKSAPGVADEDMPDLRKKWIEDFWDRHIEYTREARAALGAVQHLNPTIKEVVNSESWQMPEDKVPELRDALVGAEKRLIRRPGAKKSKDSA